MSAQAYTIVYPNSTVKCEIPAARVTTVDLCNAVLIIGHEFNPITARDDLFLLKDRYDLGDAVSSDPGHLTQDQADRLVMLVVGEQTMRETKA